MVTEGWLGPVYSTFPKESEIKQNFKSLAEIYKKAFEQFKKILSPSGKIVISVPAYRQDRDRYTFFPDLDFIQQLGYSIEVPLTAEIMEKYKFLKVTERGSMVYDRKDQIVAREIMIIKSQ